jgi:hypothetical protein
MDKNRERSPSMHEWGVYNGRRLSRFELSFRIGKNDWKISGDGARHSGHHSRIRQKQLSIKSHYFINRYAYIQCSSHPVNRKPENFTGNLPKFHARETEVDNNTAKAYKFSDDFLVRKRRVRKYKLLPRNVERRQCGRPGPAGLRLYLR